MCWSSGEEVEHMLTFTSALCIRKAVIGFGVVTMNITIAGQIGATWRTFLFIVNTSQGLFLYSMYCLHHTKVLYEVTEVTFSHTILCTQRNK